MRIIYLVYHDTYLLVSYTYIVDIVDIIYIVNQPQSGHSSSLYSQQVDTQCKTNWVTRFIHVTHLVVR
jgi:hypothetical protein